MAMPLRPKHFFFYFFFILYYKTNFIIFTKEIFQGPPTAKVNFDFIGISYVCKPETKDVRDNF